MVAEIKVEFDIPARMRDGTILYSNVFRPSDGGDYPVVLTRTPYAKDGMTNFLFLDMVRLAQKGYIVVAQDVRGRFTSMGEWKLMKNEAEDGYDSVEWAAGLPGSNGNVGMVGISYLGYAQYAAAAQHPPHLKALMPAVTYSDARNGMFWRGGALELGILLHLLLPSLGADTLLKRYAGKAELAAKMADFIREVDRLPVDGYRSLPLKDLAPLKKLGLDLDLLADLIEHPNDARFSRPPFSPTDFFAKVNVPVYHIGGWHDAFINGTLQAYAALRRNLPDGRNRMIIGPWSHTSYSNLQGDLDFGTTSQMWFIEGRMGLVELTDRWFERWLKGVQNGVEDEPPVKIFVMGANTWRTEASWPLPGTQYIPYYIHPDGSLQTTTPAEGGSPDSYVYDPADPTPTLGGNILMSPAYGVGARDQRPVEARPDVLSYTSAPLDRALTVIGPVKVELWAASDAPDTDFVARLVDVHPDGYAQNLCDGILRARYRRGDRPEMLEASKPYLFEIDLWSTANVFLPGHRIRLDLASASFPRWDRNPNTGDPFGQSATLRPALQTVFQDADRATRVILPVVEE